MTRRALLALAGLLALAPTARSQDAVAPPVAITGRVEQPTTYSLTALAAAPALEVQGAIEGGVTASFVGTPLWPLVAAARPIAGTGPGARAQPILIAHGADGYAAILALAEIDPFFEGKPVLIAYKMNGQLLPAPRLVVPGDKHGGRNVRALVSVEVQ